MYKLLIVDDEVLIAKGIQATVEWSKFEISNVNVSYNIRQAKEVFMEKPADIFICDIEMPEGNGFELLQWVKERYPATQAIFLTCHANFEYAQRAIQLGGLDYMLKPVMKEQLEEVIVKALRNIDRDREIERFNEVYNHYYKLWSSQQPLLVERFWQDLLTRQIPANRGEIEERMGTLHIPYDGNARYVPVLISIHRWHKELNLREEKIMEYALRKAAEEAVLQDGRSGHVVSVEKGKLLLIIHAEGQTYDYAVLQQDCGRYIQACNEYLFCRLSCYIGACEPIENLVESIGKLNEMEHRNVTVQNQAFLYQEMDKGAKTRTELELPQLTIWAELLKRGESEQLGKEMSDYFDRMAVMEGLDRCVLTVFCQNYMQMVHQSLRQKHISEQQLLNDLIVPERILAATRSVIALKEYALEIAGRAAGEIRNADTTLTLIDKVKLYIAGNIDKDFSRQDMADHLNLSPDYIVRLFKKETGLSITDYIVDERVRNAKELLIRTEISISDIALMVGYSNFSYFSKVFKKATASNPQEFRKKYRREEL